MNIYLLFRWFNPLERAKSLKVGCLQLIQSNLILILYKNLCWNWFVFIWFIFFFIFLYFLQVNGVYILKSGSDFRQFSKINLDFRETPVVVEIECIDVTKDIEPDEELSKKLEEYNGKNF